MSIRNYNAWLKAARKAGKKTGGLSLPAARKAYRKMAARVGRPLKGTDVSKHPRIFRESLPAANRKPAGLGRGGAVRKQTRAASRARDERSKGSGIQGAAPRRIPAKSKPATRGGVVSRKAQQARTPRVVVGKPQSDLLQRQEAREGFSSIEYISTPEYTKRGAKGGFYLQLQIHIIGPPGLSKRKLDQITKEWLQDGSTPTGIEVKALGWNGKNPTQERRGMRVARTNFSHIPFTF